MIEQTFVGRALTVGAGAPDPSTVGLRGKVESADLCADRDDGRFYLFAVRLDDGRPLALDERDVILDPPAA